MKTLLNYYLKKSKGRGLYKFKKARYIKSGMEE